jgi:hypothetical protein
VARRLSSTGDWEEWMADCESSREGNEDSKATRRNSLKRAGRTTYPRKELPISMKLRWSANLCGSIILAGTAWPPSHRRHYSITGPRNCWC